MRPSSWYVRATFAWYTPSLSKTARMPWNAESAALASPRARSPEAWLKRAAASCGSILRMASRCGIAESQSSAASASSAARHVPSFSTRARSVGAIGSLGWDCRKRDAQLAATARVSAPSRSSGASLGATIRAGRDARAAAVASRSRTTQSSVGARSLISAAS